MKLIEETGSFEDCDSLLTSAVKGDSVMEIKAAGIPIDKLVIGKPARQEDVNNGYMSSSTLASCLSTAKGEGWSAGVMVWQVSMRPSCCTDKFTYVDF